LSFGNADRQKGRGEYDGEVQFHSVPLLVAVSSS
jgi:hypothetical protein